MRHQHSYRQKRLEEKALRDAAGPVSARYAGISCIEVRLTYYQRAVEPVLMERTLRYFPTSDARFFMRCARSECTGGGYDLEPVIERLVRSRKRAVSGKLYCRGADESIGHGSIAYAVSVTYDGGAHRAK